MNASGASAEIPVVILCGGMGTRLREASERLPKPLVDIGGRPILWHIMKTYSHYGFRRFILCLGYKGDQIKRYFLDYRHYTGDFSLRLAAGQQPRFHNSLGEEDWDITFVETGLHTGTGARLRRVRDHLDADVFMLTYGDGVGAVDVPALLRTHAEHGLLATVTGVHPTSRYGEMRESAEGARVAEFNEKPTQVSGWVSGGYFVFQEQVIDKYLDQDESLLLESQPLQRLARDGQLGLYRHEGFWMGMDTYRDWTELNRLWDSGAPPWRLWDP